jgi:hypothetical protein
MLPSKIVLSHPFSGSLYAFFTEQMAGSDFLHLDHPYYKTLYGKSFREVRDITLTLTTIYPKIILIPADNHLPDTFIHGSDEDYDPDLGISSEPVREL